MRRENRFRQNQRHLTVFFFNSHTKGLEDKTVGPFPICGPSRGDSFHSQSISHMYSQLDKVHDYISFYQKLY